MAKIISAEEAANLINDGDILLVGGFYAIGTPENIVSAIHKQGKKGLTIVNNDGGNPNSALGKLLYSGQVKKIVLSWCGYLSEIPKMVENGDIELELNPQGSLIERIRAGGFGLGGVLTKTGLGTMVEEKGVGKRVTLNDEDYLYHTPIRGNVTIVEAYEADEDGNLIFRRTQRNFCDIMCFSGDIVIASVVKPIKRSGELDPDSIMVPGALVDYLVVRGDNCE